VSRLTEEAEYLLHRQRQKGADYKYREGAGRPDLVAAGLLPPPPGATPAVAASPKKAAAASAGPDAVAPSAAAGDGSLDDYDPKESAAKELRDLTEMVSDSVVSRCRGCRFGALVRRALTTHLTTILRSLAGVEEAF
jgi:hypothetical protein